MKYKLSFRLYHGEDETYCGEVFDTDTLDDAKVKAHEYLMNFYGEGVKDEEGNYEHALCEKYLEEYWYFGGESVARKIYLSETKDVKDNFTEQELIEILEFARIAITDGEIYDKIAETCDLSDEYLKGLQTKLENFMEGVRTWPRY